jgi:hypothetical protein
MALDETHRAPQTAIARLSKLRGSGVQFTAIAEMRMCLVRPLRRGL